MKTFTYGLVGEAVVKAETKEEADKLLWDMTLLEANIEVEDVEEIDEEEEQEPEA